MTFDSFEYENSKEVKEVERSVAEAMKKGLAEDQARFLYDRSPEYLANQFFNFK